jgi:hypothetical protein
MLAGASQGGETPCFTRGTSLVHPRCAHRIDEPFPGSTWPCARVLSKDAREQLSRRARTICGISCVPALRNFDYAGCRWLDYLELERRDCPEPDLLLYFGNLVVLG